MIEKNSKSDLKKLRESKPKHVNQVLKRMGSINGSDNRPPQKLFANSICLELNSMYSNKKNRLKGILIFKIFTKSILYL